MLGQASSPATSAITTGIGVVGKGGKGEGEREGGASCPVLVPSMTQGCRDRFVTHMHTYHRHTLSHSHTQAQQCW